MVLVVHKGKLRLRKGKGLAQGHRAGQCRAGPVSCSCSWPPAQGAVPGFPQGKQPPSALLPGVGGLVPACALPPPLSLGGCHKRPSSPQAALHPPDQLGQGEGGKDHPRHCRHSPTRWRCPSGVAPTWICSMQCCGDSADTHWISGLSLCRLKATAMSPHFRISGVDSTHQCR